MLRWLLSYSFYGKLIQSWRFVESNVLYLFTSDTIAPLNAGADKLRVELCLLI
jgi:hypothetical protein